MTSAKPLEQDDLFTLIADYCDGTISNVDGERLTTLLRDDITARELYVEYLDLHLALRKNARSQEAEAGNSDEDRSGWTAINEEWDLGLAASGTGPSAGEDLAGARLSTPRPPTTMVARLVASARRHVPGGEFTVGSLLLLAIVAACWGLGPAILHSRSGDHNLAESSDGDKAEPVAVIRSSNDVAWAGNARDKSGGAPTTGIPIAQNQPLRINAGLIELQLKSGATLLIEGPADWQINGENAATLTHGKLVARVPHQAVGFTLDTPETRIVDLGTEFGVEVGADGGADVHVLQGRIKVETGKGQEPAEDVHLHAGEAITILPASVAGSQEIQRKVANPQLFTRQLQVPKQSPGPLTVDRAGLRLWLRADRGVELDSAGRVERWADQSPWKYDAVQQDSASRPTVVRRDEGRSPVAIQFDGKQTFLACTGGLEIDLARDLTMFAVVTAWGDFQQNAGLVSLIPRNGLDWNSADGLCLAQFISDRGENEVLFHYFRQEAVTDGFRLRKPVPPELPVVITVTRIGKTAVLRCNGSTTDVVEDQRGGPPLLQTLHQTGYCLGARYDDGSGKRGFGYWGASTIAEVLVFDRALGGRERADIEQELHARSLRKHQ